jgi:hypothetical protein
VGDAGRQVQHVAGLEDVLHLVLEAGEDGDLGALVEARVRRVLQAPASNFLMVTGQQHVRHPPPFVFFGPRVVRAIQQTRDKGILFCRLGVVQHPRQLPDDGIQQSHRRDFASREDEIPN